MRLNIGFPVVRADGRAGGQAVGVLSRDFQISGMGRFNYPWCSAGALRAPELRYYKTVASLMHYINGNNSPTNLFNLFEKTVTIHSYHTRSSTSGNFHVKSSKLEIHKNSLSRFGVKLWNEIPCHIRDLPKKKFTKVLHRLLSDILKREDDYIET